MYLDWIRDGYPFEWFNIEKDKEHKEREKSNERKD